MLAEVANFVESLALRWAIGNRNELEALLRENDDLDAGATALGGRLDGWEETEAGKAGARESVRSVSALALAAYGLAGVTLLRWVAGGSESCPYCQSLDGKVVGRGDAFVPAGDFQPEGAETALKVRRSAFHPPVHDGCSCSVIAG